MNYYNEFHPQTAQWLRELIAAGEIPNGIVDDRSIVEVTPGDLAGFNQCHFFAGIGGWPLALRLAGVPDNYPLWTGSPPCQPYSVAGKKLGFKDERHLAPTLLRLVSQCRPRLMFGEQVAAAIGDGWLDYVSTVLERDGYGVGSAVLAACVVGAPHRRERLYFGAVDGVALSRGQLDRRAIPGGTGSTRCPACGHRTDVVVAGEPRRASEVVRRMGYTNSAGSQRWSGMCECTYQFPIGSGRVALRPADKVNGFWSGADWLGCRDGKFRPVIPSFITLADGVPDILGLSGLQGHGSRLNALFELPEGIGAETFFFGRTRVAVDAQAPQVLRSSLHGGTHDGSDPSDESEKLPASVGSDGEGAMRGVLETSGAPRSSQGSRPFKQRSVQFDDLVLELSSQSSFAELDGRRRDASAMSLLRQTCLQRWDVRDTPDALETAWSSFSEETKSRERLDFDASRWAELDFFPLSDEDPHRVDRIRGYGNAIVPQLAAEFVTSFLESCYDLGGR